MLNVILKMRNLPIDALALKLKETELYYPYVEMLSAGWGSQISEQRDYVIPAGS